MIRIDSEEGRCSMSLEENKALAHNITEAENMKNLL